MALGKRRTEQDENEIDMTPMLAGVFIMLIFFIVTASFVNEVGLGVNRPPTTDQPPPNTENTNIVFRSLKVTNLLLRVEGLIFARYELTLRGCMLRGLRHQW